MKCSDISSVRSRSNTNPGCVYSAEVVIRKRPLWKSPHSRNATRYFARWHFVQFRPCRDDVGIAPASFDIGQPDISFEDLAIALLHNKSRCIDDVTSRHKTNKLRIDRLI